MMPIDHKSWLDPVLPEKLPESILSKADMIPMKAGMLQGRLASGTAKRLSKLLRITSTYYSNLIEGQYTEPADMQRAQQTPKKGREQLHDLAVQHMRTQRVLERKLRGSEPSWNAMFDAELIKTVHRLLFAQIDEAHRLLSDGTPMVPGELRSVSEREVVVGNHAAPAAKVVESMMGHLQRFLGGATHPGRQLIAAMAYHHRLAWVHPFPDGNGRVARMMTHLQLAQLGLGSDLWSLSRGLARRQDDYYRFLAGADQPRKGDLDGRGQMSQSGYFAFIEFMLDVCHDQLDYMLESLDPEKLYERITRSFKTNERILDCSIRPECGKAVHALIRQGSIPRADFKAFTGLPARAATDQLTLLVKVGLVHSPTPKSRTLSPGFPVWFAQDIFPDLHRRFI